MEITSLGPLADELLATARAAGSSAGRSGRTVFGGHGSALGQTMIALLAGSTLSDHENPGQATVLVVRGRVRLTVEESFREGTPYDLLPVPEAVHGLEAVEDSVVLLTVARQV
ncbi:MULTISPECIES: LuxR family transcriptional regulator [Streptomyces]|uniref:LuxR family transcriptional regulator n=1 Tax=Streptomyces TaxID=1883 RepID=UPI002270C07A|nr:MULTISPECIES: LuxR family transcriptional regulator [unclassified Streptomyces]MCY0944964.1 LuxR family transcriptional regulator [Streptomyces sp. H34-AA3]MCY0951489.1 LuxR family transcriptional regulator [Streptomyces sp. H27-S2]MCZ4082136.1 LuxR family transcriptional regulator [Streptomyces sp. H34-S5]